MSDLARKLSAAKERTGITNASIASALGVSDSTSGHWFNGRRTPTIGNLSELVRLLGIEMADLWTDPESTPASPAVRALIDVANSLSSAQQDALLALAKTMQAPPRT